MGRLLVVLIAALIVAPAVLAQVSQAYAQERGPCEAWIDGIPAHEGPIYLDRYSDVATEVITPRPFTRNVVYVEAFGVRWLSVRVNSTEPAWFQEVPVSRISRWGVGAYTVGWESYSEEGFLLCRLVTTIIVEGSPFEAVVGIGGIATLVIGLTGLVFTLKTTIYEGAKWVVKVVLGIKAEKDEEGDYRLKASLSFSNSLLGTLWGLLLSGGTLAMIQQAALSVPTVELALELVLPFAALGALGGLLRLRRERTAPHAA